MNSSEKKTGSISVSWIRHENRKMVDLQDIMLYVSKCTDVTEVGALLDRLSNQFLKPKT